MPALQVLDSRNNDRVAEQDCPDERAGAGHGVGGIKGPVHYKGIQDEHDAQQSLPQMDGRMFVVMAATAAIRPVLVVVLAEKRGDLHVNNDE